MNRDKETVERLDLVLAALPDLWRDDFLELVSSLIRTSPTTDPATDFAVRRWLVKKEQTGE